MSENQFENALIMAMEAAGKSAIEAAIKHNTSVIIWDEENNKMKEISAEKIKKELIN